MLDPSLKNSHLVVDPAKRCLDTFYVPREKMQRGHCDWIFSKFKATYDLIIKLSYVALKRRFDTPLRKKKLNSGSIPSTMWGNWGRNWLGWGMQSWNDFASIGDMKMRRGLYPQTWRIGNPAWRVCYTMGDHVQSNIMRRNWRKSLVKNRG